MPASDAELRELYQRMKSIQDQEAQLRKQLSSLTKTKNDIRGSIEKYMIQTQTACIGVTGTPDTLELVETNKYESLTKEVVIRKIMTFFQQAGATSQYRQLAPVAQAQALVHAIYTERERQVVKKLKLKTDKNVVRVQQQIEDSLSIAAPTAPATHVHTAQDSPTTAGAGAGAGAAVAHAQESSEFYRNGGSGGTHQDRLDRRSSGGKKFSLRGRDQH